MNQSDLDRNAYMLCGPLARKGYLRWWHSFVGHSIATGEKRTFFLEYLILNPLAKVSPKGRPQKASYVRIMAGAFPSETYEGMTLSAYYPISAAKYASKPLYFSVEDTYLSENRLSGSVNISSEETEGELTGSDAGTMEWDIEVHKTIACHTGIFASPLFCALNALDSFWHGEGIRTQYRGVVECNGESFEIQPETCFGYADKHWGSAYNSPWLQLASCRLYSERTDRFLKHSALAVNGCCPRFLFFRFKPKLFLQLTYTGEDFCYSFPSPFQRSMIKLGAKEERTRVTWQIKAQNKNSALKLTMHSLKANMKVLKYDNPDSDLRESVSKRTVRAGGSAYGTIDLYRITPTGKTWIDTLTIEDGLCICQKPRTKRRPHT